MNAGKTPTVRRCARPMNLVHAERASQAVLCLHGYSGYPGELALPAKRLYEAGYDVFVPRLPGHGTDGIDFMSTGRHQWLDASRQAYEELARTYGRVSLVGHSMGGAIAVLLASKYPVGPSVLYAPALSIPALNHTMITVLSLFMKRKPQKWQADNRYRFFDERDADDDAYLGSEYWSWLYPRQLRELSLLVREAESSLAKTKADFLVLTGGKDTTIGKDVGPLVVQEGGGNNNWIELREGTHLIPYDIDDATREEAMLRTVEWIRWGL